MARTSLKTTRSRDLQKLADMLKIGVQRSNRSRAEAALAAGIDPGHFSRVLKGEKSIGKSKLIKLARELNLNISECLDAAGYDPQDFQTSFEQMALIDIVQILKTAEAVGIRREHWDTFLQNEGVRRLIAQTLKEFTKK